MGNMLINMTGDRIGRLLVVSRAENRNNRHTYWLCKCDCGKETIVSRQSLISGNTRSCGCLQKEYAKNSCKIEDMTGKVIGRLTVLRMGEKSKWNGTTWICKCVCGKVKQISAAVLRSGGSKSCGCLQKEKASAAFLPDGGAAKNKLFGQYHSKAKRKGRSFVLSKEQFLIITKQNCAYCGSEPNKEFISKRSVYVFNGLDRVDNNKGYTLENTVSCCAICNYAKRKMSKREFLAWIEKVYHHSLGNNVTLFCSNNN